MNPLKGVGGEQSYQIKYYTFSDIYIYFCTLKYHNCKCIYTCLITLPALWAFNCSHDPNWINSESYLNQEILTSHLRTLAIIC